MSSSNRRRTQTLELIATRRAGSTAFVRRYGCLTALVMASALVVGTDTTSRAAPCEARTNADPKAMAALSRTAAYLRKLPAFSFRAEVTRDQIVYGDFKLQRASNVQVAVRRPNRLRVDVSGDQGDRLFVYDGRHLSVFLRSENYYGRVFAPPTLLETLDAVERHSIELPLVDVLYVAMGGALEPSIRDAGEIGRSMIDGIDCVQLAFRGLNVDWQLWIEQGTRALPRKIVITTNDEPTRPQYVAVLHWDLASPLSDDTFKFSPPAGVHRLTFAETQPQR
jgi:hypothetical protein